ncbi:hypothetical protein H5410_002044 [Solanum commersonii]|uniref:Ulp1 protease family, C-terminal catalytic domain containing protein n=1 Tax=Solanum commersonii TaxID=4109 RepID=A0A9J6B1S7_SOLCO|nr:hypothetical protein H5410_002044 [Solanum commersonii]
MAKLLKYTTYVYLLSINPFSFIKIPTFPQFLFSGYFIMKETKPIFLTPKISPIISHTTKSVTAFKAIGFSNDSTVSKFKIDHPYFNIGISQLITPNNEQIFEYEHPNLNEQRSKSLHITALMANRTASKRKSKMKVGSSSKAKDAKTKKKRGRKVAPPNFRPTLPMMVILYFIHTFVFSQLGDAPIPIEDFFMVEDGSYKQFPWGQLDFTKLMKSFRKEYKPDKQMYRLNGFTYELNIWVYECASAMHNEIAVRDGNGIPRVCNWKVVGAKPKYEMFMENIFTESFHQKSPEQLLRRCTRVSTTGSTPPPKRRKVAHPTKNNVSKTTPDVQKNEPFQTPISQPLKFDNISGVHLNTVPRRTSSDNARLEDLEGHIKSYIEESSIKDFAIVDHDVDANDVEEDAVHKLTQLHTKVLSCDKVVADSIKQDSKRHASNSVIVDTSDSSKATFIPSGTETVIDAIVYKLPNEPINVAPLSVIIPPPQLTNNDDFLSDSQLPTQLPIKESAHNLDTKTPAPRNRIPSKILQSPYVNTFGSSDKGKGKIDDDIRPYTPFEECGITYQVSSLLMQDDCGTYVAAFVEFLSDEIKVSSIPFQSEYLRSRYATLLWKYGTDKANADNASLE